MTGKTKDEYLEYIKFVKASLETYYDIIKIYGVNKVFMRKIIEDLEVLEILRKCLFVEEIHKGGDDYVEGLEIYLDVTDDDENCNDYHKVKQWLEENNE